MAARYQRTAQGVVRGRAESLTEPPPAPANGPISRRSLQRRHRTGRDGPCPGGQLGRLAIVLASAELFTALKLTGAAYLSGRDHEACSAVRGAMRSRSRTIQ